MSLKLVHDAEATTQDEGPRRGQRALGPAPGDVAPPAKAASRSERPIEVPKAPGPLPLALAQGLKSGEPVIWWGFKARVRWRPIAVMSVVGIAILAFITLIVPEFWSQPWKQWAQAVVAVQLPALAVFIREFKGRRTVAVTDTAVLDMDPRGGIDRIGFRSVRKVRRDWLSGGVRLVGVRHEVRVPPVLMEPAREAIASQTRHILDFGSEGPDDRVAWFPWPGRP